MKRTLITILCGAILAPGILYCEAEGFLLRGVITLLNSNNTPVANAQISSHDAKSTVSDHLGHFQLFFNGKKPGNTAELIIQKTGLEVVNRDELTVVLGRIPGIQVRIQMCPTGQRDKYAAIYYNIALESINENYNTLIDEIKRLKKDRREINQKISRLNKQRDHALARARKLADDFAKINLDDASEMYKKAFELFKKGKIDEAIEALDDAKIDQDIAIVNEKKRNAQEAKKIIAAGFILKARSYIRRFQFSEAEKNYEKAIEAEPRRFEYLFEFNRFMLEQKKFIRPIKPNKTALTLALNRDDKAAILRFLGIFYTKNNRFKEAEDSLSQSKELYWKLDKINPGAYSGDAADTLYYSGELYSAWNRHPDALPYYRKALVIQEKLAERIPNSSNSLDSPNSALCRTMLSLCAVYKTLSEKDTEPPEEYKTKGIPLINRVLALLKEYPDLSGNNRFLEKANHLKTYFENR